MCSSARRTSLATVGRLEWPFADARERSIYVTESFDETGSFVLVRPRGILGVGLGERPNEKPPGHSIQ